MKRLLLALVFIPTLLFSQSRKERKALEAQQKVDQQIISNLKNHVQSLTAPAQAQSNNAYITEYVSKQFASLGLKPKGPNGFLQPFTINAGKRIEPISYLKVNNNTAELNKDYFPLAYSAEKRVTGMPAMALRERGVPWFTDIKDWFEDGSKITVANIDEAIKKEVTKVAAKGATALFLYNTGATADGLSYDPKDKSASVSIPVLYITPSGYKKFFNDHSQDLDIDLNVSFKESILSGSNVVGYMDNGAPLTIVISTYTIHASESLNLIAAANKTATIGANDNSSGIAMLIELARILSTSKAKSNNFLFIAFAGDNNGSVGSNYWLENSSTTTPINYAINLDKVGDYGDGKKLTMQGYQSSSAWREIFTSMLEKKVEVTIDSTGTLSYLPAVFYNKSIPVLSFSTSLQSDYLSTAAEETTINYAGEVQVAKFIARIIEASDPKGKIVFSKNIPSHTSPKNVAVQGQVNADVSTLGKTAVSLGVIPDKAPDEAGLRISGVSPKKLASKLGLQPGDVLTYLGSYKISDLKSYMQVLARFKAGDKTTLKIKRGKDDIEFAVEF